MIFPNPSRVELTQFIGENPRSWIRKCHKYFNAHQIPEIQKVEVVEMYLDSKADNWYQGFHLENPSIMWQKFCDALCKRFVEKGSKDVVEEFNKLQ